ncbi:peptide N-acetyl-beta-D-glucosaminyl asparaginase amidase A-domain-containing protein [Microdochium trichocladiopsis]|uniref:Peptide N-acetyl-beta-D-glucosaminyl asparaginase amidase A-domain-containing protein n=1 Tax=Microdochium trichocladiopsis TaxID=1682393 RepID=A0A9P8YCN7_9PEZI|nr:peptide N-acetyl-beta-D-glucosaminyl asparaginase amidase A-domain-containing protein [Microdochium trichocladiopsis]KAH7035842.1 peptide N-acetyl-beta-D-glucosaminyl asparaginase amidase A-domain-containing protein [Microdochium trichocladiopsis]
MAAAGPVEFFQVAQPVLALDGPGSCTVVLMEHAFANSYGSPFVADYVPPACDFNRVVIRFTSTVRGRQYDRTGVMYLGDTEVWRLTTAQPTADGIVWGWDKDMTHFLSLWRQPQKLIFDLENIVNDVYTGIFNTTLTATFFQSDVLVGGQPPADLIIPISERTGAAGQPSQFTYPEQNATNTVAFPRNANRAVFSIAAKGQGSDEFWWSNVPQSAIHTFDAEYGQYPGYSAWREIQVLVDGKLAGVSWPYPTIFTGGVVPQLHRPIVGIDAFDMREHEIDITPWLPLLCDGNEHTFTIQVIGLVDDGSSSTSLSTTTESSWYLTGKVFVWLDSETSVTTGTIPVVSQPAPSIAFSSKITQDAAGANETLEYQIDVSRKFSVTAKVKTEKSEGLVSWSQKLSYSNPGAVTAYGFFNLNTLDTTGADASAGSVSGLYASKYHYPLFCNSTAAIAPEGNLTLWANLDQGLQLEVVGSAVIPTGVESYKSSTKKFAGSSLDTRRVGTANFHRAGDNSYSEGSGSQEQVFDFWGVTAEGGYAGKEQLYHRDVKSVNTTVTFNEESGV